MKIITVASLKGGAGKTAISIFLTQALANAGYQTLSVDLDHNNNLTDYFLRNTDTEKIESANIYHAITGTRRLSDCLHTLSGNANLSVLPATPQLARIGLELSRDPGAMLRFSRTLKSSGFDAVVIDTPPSLSFELSCALYSSSIVLSPVSFSRWTVQGFSLLRDEISGVSKAIGKAPQLLALPAQVNATQEANLRDTKFAQFAKGTIHRSAAIKAACDSGRPLKENSGSYAEFKALAKELIV